MQNKNHIRIISTIILSVFVQSHLPAEVYFSRMTEGIRQLDYYLERAEKENSFERYDSLVQEGLLSAKLAWENENTALIDSEIFKNEKENAENLFSLNTKINYEKWQEKNSLEKEKNIFREIILNAKINQEENKKLSELSDDEKNQDELFSKELLEEVRKQSESQMEKLLNSFEFEIAKQKKDLI